MAGSGSGSRFPWFAIFAISLGLFANSVQIMMPFPFLPFMMFDLGMVSDPREPGLFSGFIGGAFMAGRIFTAFLWGSFSDRAGRKPVRPRSIFGEPYCCTVVIIYALVSIVLCSLAFGFSWTYPWALGSRFMAGATNGIIATSKVMVSELCSAEQQAQCMGVTTATWAFGTIAGSSIGGLLASPSETMPDQFSASGLFGTFPYLLPCIACAFLALAALVLCAVYCPETLPAAVHRPFLQHYCSCCRCGEIDAKYGSKGSYVAVAAIDHDIDGDDQSPAPSRPIAAARGNHSQEKIPVQQNRGGLFGVMSQRVPRIAVLQYALLSFYVQLEFDVFPLWTAAPVSAGGLGLHSVDTGAMMSAMGTVQLIFSLFVFPAIHCRLGSLRALRTFQLLQIPMYIMLPVGNAFAADQHFDSVPAMWCWVVALRSVSICSLSASFTCCAILMNNSVRSSERGALNGAGMTIASIGKSLGPALGSPAFAWSLTNGLPLPLDYHMMYFSSAGLALLVAVWSTQLPATIELSPESRDEEARLKTGGLDTIVRERP